MSITGLLWLIAFLIACLAFYFWIFRGRSYGYQAIAARSKELVDKDYDTYLLYSISSVGLMTNMPMNITSWWDFINTGYLAYIKGYRLYIEFPWWNRMRPLGDVGPSDTAVDKRDFIYARTKKPGLQIGDKIYAVAGINTSEVAIIKQLLGLKDTSLLESNRKAFEFRLAATGFKVSATD